MATIRLPATLTTSDEPAGHVHDALAWWRRAGESVDILCLDGELDALTAQVLRESVASRLPEPGRSLVVDLTRLSFCGCAGLTLFLEWQASAWSENVAFRLASAAPQVHRVILVSGLTRVLPVDTDVKAAEAASLRME